MKYSAATGMLLLTLISCVSAPAQRFKSELKFEEVKQVPLTVQRQAPRGFITAHYGTSRINQGGTSVSLHLYSLPTTKASKDNLKSLHLDLFASSKKGLQRINSVKLPAGVSARITTLFTPTAWLIVKQRKSPIIPVVVNQDKEGYIKWGECHLLIFNNGLDRKPFIQKFECFCTTESVTEDLMYHGVDDRGFVILNHRLDQPTGIGESANLTDHLYYWNGKQFVTKKAE